MTKTTDTSRSPYFDDYNESKGFLSILFRPGTVQVRELNQLQTILQNQISRFGNSIFKEGAVVIPGGFQVSHQEVSLGFTPSGSTDPDVINSYQQVYVRDTTTNRRMLLSLASEGDSSHGGFAFGTVTYAGTGVDDFVVGNGIVFETTDELSQTVTLGAGTVSNVGSGSIATINKGVYYIRGYFVLVEDQQIVLDAYQEIQNGRVGLDVREDIITASQDATLYSNATGEINEKAEGANRFQMSLSLVFRELEGTFENFIELVRYTDGYPVTAVQTSEYSLIGDALAQRTYEESGNYTVGDYDLTIREHADVFPASPDDSKIVAVLGSGISYVRGYRIANEDPVNLVTDKARETDVSDNAVVGMNYGGYIEVTSPKGVPEVSGANRLEFYDVSDNKVADAVLFAYNDQKAYLVNIRNEVGYNVQDAVKVVQIVSATTVFEAVVSNPTLSASDIRAKVFTLPVTGATSLLGGGATNVLYRITKVYEVTLASGSAVISAGATDLLFDPDTSAYLLGSRDVGTFVDYVEASFTRTGAEVGTSLSIQATDTGLNGTYYLMAKMIKRGTSQRSKVSSQQTDAVVLNGTSVSLSKADGIRLISVFEGATDVTSEFVFDDGQTDTFYGACSVTSKLGSSTGRNLNVTYEYYAHGVGDFFGADSYSSVAREITVQHTLESGVTLNLRDCIDFRPVIVGATVSSGNFVWPDTSFVADIEYYLPRIDSVIVSYENGYQIIKGVSANDPERPALPKNAMRLFDVLIPAYTPNVDDAWVLRESNKRFTMKDISNLEQRISNLEYYTSLSALEADTSNIQAIDPITGQNRFKNGIFADPLLDYRLLDVEASEASISEDNNGQMFPRLIQNAVDMELVSGGIEEDGMVMPSYAEVASVIQPFATAYINVNPYAVFSWNGFVELTPSQDFWVDVKYIEPKVINQTVNYRGTAKQGVVYSNWKRNSWSNQQVRNVTTTVFTETNTTTVQDNLIETKIIPYMRSIEISFKATGLRPLTRVYPYFDGVNVSEFTRPTGLTNGEPIVTDTQGAVNGVFTVPNSSSERFSTGKTTFILVDNEVEAATSDDGRTTFATASFESGGREETRQKVTTKTRTLGFTQRTTQQYRRYDPVAQSFAISTQGGEFISSIDLFFFSKSDSIPVTLEIRAMENGLPTHDVIARVSVNPDNVTVSSDCSVETNFKLPYPVYLEQEVEYCLVVLANTQDYQIGYAELGQQVLGTGYAVAKQPNTGVMFTSANGSTWTPHQNRDLKFKTYRCNWSTNTAEILFRPKLDAQSVPLGENPISGVSGESVVTVRQEAHGLQVGDTIFLANSAVGLGLVQGELNGARTVTEVVDYDNFKIGVGGTLTSTGVIYQPSQTVVTVTSCYLFNLLYTNLNVLDNDSVSIAYEYRFNGLSGQTAWLPFSPNSDVNTPVEGRYFEAADFEIKATMTMTTNIAPQIDLHGFTTVMNSYYVSSDTDKPRYTYISKAMYFNNPSTKLQFYMNLLLPGSSTFKAYVQAFKDDEPVWEEVQPTTPLFNDGANSTEYKFEYELIQDEVTFSGARVKFEFYSSRTDAPVVSDIRGVAFA